MRTNHHLSTLILVLLSILYGCKSAPTKSNKKSPNFIIILSDDQGWNGTSVQMMDEEIRSMSASVYRTVLRLNWLERCDNWAILGVLNLLNTWMSDNISRFFRKSSSFVNFWYTFALSASIFSVQNDSIILIEKNVSSKREVKWLSSSYASPVTARIFLPNFCIG